MRNSKNAEALNKELRQLQQQWYDKLPKEYKEYDDFSSPFCFGISNAAWSDKLPLIMYIGEEPKGWWFNDENHHEQDIEYLQEYSIAYLEKQLYSTSDFWEYQCVKDYPHVFDKQNTSPFWTFIRDVYKENDTIKYNVCWNNLDKLHRIVESKTKPLTYEMEAELHNILLFEKSLLLNEIELVKPDIIIFMGKYYNKSMAGAMGNNYGVKDLDKYSPSPETFFVSEVKEIPTPLQKIIKKMIWIYHPNYIQHQGIETHIAAKKQVQEILKNVKP